MAEYCPECDDEYLHPADVASINYRSMCTVCWAMNRRKIEKSRKALRKNLGDVMRQYAKE